MKKLTVHEILLNVPTKTPVKVIDGSGSTLTGSAAKTCGEILARKPGFINAAVFCIVPKNSTLLIQTMI